MIGRKLAERLAKEGAVGGRAIGELALHDVVPPPPPGRAPYPLKISTSDLAAPGEAEKLVAGRPELVFHLAAIVSGEAEADFEKGYHVNLDGTRRLFEAIRKI